ncbi:hypothetical protein F4806DRAFT_500538 [Annulohypoxylon nitens]|nr:hypothetical protein F4806DRAFT_500538 [Annulohypoxylon nitens]
MEKVDSTKPPSARPEHLTVISQTPVDATQATNRNPLSTGNAKDDVPRQLKLPIDDLFDAIQSNSITRMKKILESNLGIINMQNDPESPISLQEAVKEKNFSNLMTPDILQCLQAKPNTDLLKHLQSQGTDINNYIYGKQCPIHVACIFGNPEAVEVLLEYPQIDLNATNGSKETPLGVACRAAELQIAKMLLEKPRSNKEHANEKNNGKNDINIENKIIRVTQEDDVGNTPIVYLAYKDGLYTVQPETIGD